MRIVRVTTCLIAVCGMTACSEPPPPVSVAEFMENPRLLEATMVRCGQNRSEMKYEAECVNARDAVNRLERAEEQERKARLEAQSERKRQQLRATQEAAAAARRRAEEERRRREEAEYLGMFEESPAGEVTTAPQSGAATPPPADSPAGSVEPLPEETAAAPVAAPADAQESDLASIREELRRRQEEPE